jgi:CheY-like chemotaxis protein
MNEENQLSTEAKLLIVEDHPITRCAIEAMVEDLGYQADFAENGEEALGLYHSKYELILMDLNLPDLSGLEVAQKIRMLEKEKSVTSVPIIAITSHIDEPEWEEACIKAGMNGVSGKPTSEKLKTWIEKYIN